MNCEYCDAEESVFWSEELEEYICDDCGITPGTPQ